MRFTIAIGILAQGLVASTEPPFANLLKAPTNSISTPRKNILSQVKRRRVLSRKLLHENGLAGVKNAMHLRENRIKCDPDAGTDPDTGILADQCLPGQSCSELGYCVGHAPGVEIHPTSSYRSNISIVYDGYSQDGYYDLLCSESGEYQDYFKCDCTSVDKATQSGNIYCTTQETICLEDTCFDAFLGFAFNGTFTQYTEAYSCYKFSAPYEQYICYSVSAGMEDCSIYIDDVKCDSCKRVEDYTAGDSYSCSPAIVFDCTNIVGGNAGNDCVGDSVSNILANIGSTTIPVVETVPSLHAIIYGISSMSIQEQQEWATLTAEYIVSYYLTEKPNLLQDLHAQIGVLAIIPYESTGSGRTLHQCGGAVEIVYNIYLAYSIEDPESITPLAVAQMPFLAESDQANYIQLLVEFGRGDFSCINDIDPLGQQKAMRPGKSGKKSKKSSKSSKASKNDKKGSDKGSQIYNPPPVDYLIDDDYFQASKPSKAMNEFETHMDEYPHYDGTTKSAKKGKSRKR